jgi:hypothetical protein
MKMLNIRTVVHNGNILTIYFTIGPNLSGKVYLLNKHGEDVTEDGSSTQILRSIIEAENLNIPGYMQMNTVNLGKEIVRHP